MRIKPGVMSVENHPSILHAIEVADWLWRRLGLTLTITSLQDGRHSRNSFHYGIPGDIRCRGVDFRTYDILESKLSSLVDDLRAHLGLAYDVVLESDHIHVEVDYA